MEVESPTQHSPIHIDVQSHYQATLYNMKYYPVKKRWEIVLKLEDKKEDKLLGETNIFWPHVDPPHTIIYDADNSLLHWENSESIAYLPITIPTRPVYDFSEPHSNKSNSKILIRPSFSDLGGRSSKIQRETPWKNMVLNKDFLKMKKEDFEALEHKFSPLFEQRLSAEEQREALTAIRQQFNGSLDIRFFMDLMLKMRFFDLSILNSFIEETYSKDEIVTDDTPATSAQPTPKKKKKAPKRGTRADVFLEKLIAHPQFMLFDNSFLSLLKLCAFPPSKHLRKLLVEKSIPLNNNLCRRIFLELENESIVSLLELYTSEFITSSRDANLGLSGKVLDLLLFITNGLNDKLLWNDNSASFNERLSAVLHAIKACSIFSFSWTKQVSSKEFRSTIGDAPPPLTDYSIRVVKCRRHVVG